MTMKTIISLRFSLLFCLLIITLISAFSCVTAFVPLPRSASSSYRIQCSNNLELSVTATKFELGIFSQVGADPNRPQKVNQDAHFHGTLTKGGQDCYTCIGVLDGHGIKGHIVSAFLALQLPLHFQKSLETLTQEQFTWTTSSTSSSATISMASIEEFEEKLAELSGLASDELNYKNNKPLIHQAMIQAFHGAHWAAAHEKDIPSGRNGATCVMVVVDHEENLLHVAHVGDSRVVWFGKQKEAIPLSVETTVKIDSEKERIEKGEGEIRGSNVFYGPVGIAMTRSLGNVVMLRAGVVPTPLVETFSGIESGEHLVLATDGVWDVLNHDSVLDLVSEGQDSNMDAQTLSNRIAAEARRKWVGDLPIMDEEKVDDITCVVVRAM